MEPTEGSVTRQGTIAALLELGSGFDGDLTVRENTYLRGAMLGYTRKFMDEMYDQIIAFAELTDFQDCPFKQLSSGMKSRLAFSIASLVQPDILILDEVLSVGDGAFRKKSEAKMREIIGGGATTILVSHSIQQIRQLCNKVLWLHNGKQIAFGSTADICNKYEEFLIKKNSEYVDSNSDRRNFVTTGKANHRLFTRLVPLACAAAICIGCVLWTQHTNSANDKVSGTENSHQTEEASILLENASSPLTFNDGTQDLQACHPSVISFQEPWNGYRYWIAFSPYPGRDDFYENPYVFASNDQIHWEVPDGLENPLDPAPENYEHEKVYNSDPELVYNSDTQELECWWRYVDDIHYITALYRRKSSDGIHWSEKECMTLTGRKSIDYVSFALIYEDHLYKMWSVAKLKPQYCESVDGKEWSERRAIELELPSTLKVWHLDVIHTEKYGYEMLFVPFDSEQDEFRHHMSLYYAYSSDNKSYSKPLCILKPTGKEDTWDSTGLYRSSLLYDINGKYYIYYTGINGETGSYPDTENVGVVFWNGH